MVVVKFDWAYLKEKPQNVILELNHVLPTCSNQSDQTKALILGGLWIVPPIYIEFISPIEKVK